MKLHGITIKRMSTSIDGGYILTFDIPENNKEQAKELFGAESGVTYILEIHKE